MVAYPDHGAATAVFAMDAARGDLLVEQADAQDVRVRALAAPVGSALAAPVLAGAAVPTGRWPGCPPASSPAGPPSPPPG